MRQPLFILAVALGSFLTCARAEAHGAFPEGRQLMADPTNAQRLWLRTTYGILLSEDRGTAWQWICYEAPGYTTAEEPVFGVTGNGTLLGAMFDGLHRTTDGCGWEPVSTELSRTTNGLAIDPSNPNHVWALISRGAGDGGFESELWGSNDGGDSFALVGAPYGSDGLLLSLAMTPADPKRLYISGTFAAGGGALVNGVLASKDAGKTWTRSDIDAPAGSSAFIAAADPKVPDTVYVRFERSTASTQEVSESWLMVSLDGGQTFKEVLRKKAILFGFTFTPDASKVMVGFGDPQGSFKIEPADLGLYAAPTGSADFQQLHPNHISCLSFIGNDLYACTSQFSDGFELGLSVDQGLSFTPVMELGQVTPLQCAAGSRTGDLCAAPWSGHVCNDIGACSPADAGPNGGNASDDGGGCGCRISEASDTHTLFGLLSAGLAAAFALRRRRHLLR
ncbi:MAG: hypothetical protein IPI67_37045 [Myxococcales bacterium]|nr:hypothetical protein [Myxococcales bacterium]